jgi:phage terminase large subunit-like protein
MQDFDELKQIKAQCLRDITEALPDYVNRLNSIDDRLLPYVEDAISNNASHANLYELLGIRKEMRLMDSYPLDPERVKRSLRAIEGQWANGRHVKGGLKFSTPRGSQHVRLMPFQAWLIFEIYAFKVDVSMEREYHDGDMLLPTEWVRDGMVWDTRRLTQEAHWFLTRKSGKTELGGAVDFTEVGFLGDVNGQALICTNSSEQSQIAYKAIREFAMQVDPTCSNRMGGKYFRMTRNGLNWQPGHPMKGEIKCMAAGKTSKDGLYASVVHADEHGQAGYVNAHSDMQAAVDTCWGSTGPRREKLLLHTTTAGRIKEGPYKTKLEQVEASLLGEMQYPLGQRIRTSDDYWCAFLLQLDKWELTDDLTKLDDPELFKKVNRSIGTTVQPTYYRERLHEAATGTEDTKQEVLTKDFNMWQQAHISEWIKPDMIRANQERLLREIANGEKYASRVDHCTADKGWVVFCGMDFSMGDDLYAHGYLCVNTQTGDLLADMDAWITQETLEKISIRPLYEQWIKDGWLHVCEGGVIDTEIPVKRIISLTESGVNIMRIGFDPYRSPDPVNMLKAWVHSLGLKPDVYVVPVSQTLATYNQPVEQLTAIVKHPDGMLRFSPNPLWPYCFGCSVLEKDNRMENKKPVKRNPGSDACKVDPIQALLSAWICWNHVEGSEMPVE